MFFSSFFSTTFFSSFQHRRSSQNSSRLNSQHVNQFLNGINHHITDGDIAKGLDRSNGVVMNGINRITDSDIVPGTNSDSLLSESLLARVNRNRDQDNRNRDQDNRNRDQDNRNRDQDNRNRKANKAIIICFKGGK